VSKQCKRKGIQVRNVIYNTTSVDKSCVNKSALGHFSCVIYRYNRATIRERIPSLFMYDQGPSRCKQLHKSWHFAVCHKSWPQPADFVQNNNTSDDIWIIMLVQPDRVLPIYVFQTRHCSTACSPCPRLLSQWLSWQKHVQVKQHLGFDCNIDHTAIR